MQDATKMEILCELRIETPALSEHPVFAIWVTGLLFSCASCLSGPLGVDLGREMDAILEKRGLFDV